MVFLFGINPLWLLAQSNTFNNPITCSDGWAIRDNSCPEEAAVGNPDIFQVSVDNAPGTALGADVFLKEVRILIQHTWIGDLDIELIAPSGRSITLLSDLGGGDDNLGDVNAPDCSGYVSFDVGSCFPIANDLPPFLNGPYQPFDNLLQFNDGVTDPNGVWTLQICDDVVEDAGTLEYFELIFEPLSCLPLQNPEVLLVDTTSAIIDWMPEDNCGTIVLEYGLPGFTPGTGFQAGEGQVISIAECSPFTLSGLAPDTDYEVYLRNFCTSTNAFSLNSCPLFFRTGCLPAPATLISNFDDESICDNTCGTTCPLTGTWKNVEGEDDFDWLVNEGVTPTFGTGPDSDISGDGNYLYIEASGTTSCPSGSKAYLQSGCIEFDKSGSDTCHLSFNYHMLGFGAGSLSLEVSDDGGVNWEEVWKKSGNQGEQWRKVYLGLSQYPDGATLQLRFVAEKGIGSKGDMAIDEIIFYGSTEGGDPDTRFYADKDGDGFGDAQDFILTCSGLVPDGFVSNSLDCDDNNSDINPEGTEIPCNGIDENCNGNLDDVQIGAPEASGDTICSGETAEICAVPANPENFIIWYGSADGDDVLGPPGNCFTPDLPANDRSIPQEYRFFAQEVGVGCASISRTEVIVIVNPIPVLSVEQQPSVCPAEQFNLAEVSISDANFTGGTLSFSDSFPITSQNTLEDLLVDPELIEQVYYQMLTPQGCIAADSFRIDLQSGPELDFSPGQNLGLCGGASEKVTVIPQGGRAPYQFLWSNGVQSDSVIISIPPDNDSTFTLSVTVNDADGCVSTDSISFSNTNGLIGVQRSVTPVSVCGGRDGQILLRPLSGTAPFVYTWSGTGGIRGDSIVNNDIFLLDSLPQAAYNITITDASSASCEFTVRSVLVNGPNAVLNAPEVKPVSCIGANDGEICLEAQLGGTPNYLWSTGDTTACISGLAGGTYSVTVTEGACSTIIENIVVTEPEALTVVIESTRPTCEDRSDGAIAVEVFGGTPGYQFEWSNGNTQKDQVNIAGGIYELTVSDANGCERDEIIQLQAPEPLRLFRDSVRDISCFGENDGFIRISTVGGQGPYQYRWSNGTQSPIATDLSRGDYTISVTDFKGCQETLDFVIAEPDSLSVTIANIQQPLCVGDTTGLISLSVSGGSMPYTYQWNTGADSNTIANIGVGIYEVIVIDARQCLSDTLTIELTAAAELDLAASVTAPTCFGRADGQIQLTSQSNKTLTFSWANGDTSGVLNNLTEGEYEVQIMDEDGCQYDTTFTLMAPQIFNAEQDIRMPSCFGENDGLITTNVNGNFTMPLAYRWEDGSTTRNRVGVAAGNYQQTITDANGCVYITDTISVKAPDSLQAVVLETGGINCRGEASGFIELLTTGGTEPYRFDWTNTDQSAESIFNVPAGEYQVRITDANNCIYETAVALAEPEPLFAEIDVILGEVCSGDSTNMLMAQASGGIGPYLYQWNNEATTRVIENVPSGDYLVSVTDANNCTEITPSVKVKGVDRELTLLEFSATDISCNGQADGVLRATVAGGRPPFRFHFSNNFRGSTLDNQIIADSLPVDRDYRVTITDANGCTVISEKKSISQPSLLRAVINEVQGITCFGGSDGKISATISGGTRPYEVSWTNQSGEVISNEEDIDNLLPGTYRLEVIDSNGCSTAIDGISIEEAATQISLRDTFTTIGNVSCRNGTDGFINIAVQGGASPYQFSWNNGATTRVNSNLEAGVYTLTVTDDNNCTAVFDSIIVTEPSATLEPDLFIRDASCAGLPSGSATIEVTGGVPPYEYFWLKDGLSFVANLDTINDLLADQYAVRVIDSAGCEKEVSFEINQPDVLELSIEIIRGTNDSIDRLEASAKGGVGNYTYLWNTGETTESIAFAGVQDYSVTVTDANNCTVSDTIFLTAVNAPEIVNQAILFPNPTAQRAMLKLTLSQSRSLEVRVYSVFGNEVYRGVNYPALVHDFEIDLSNQPSGIYLIRVVSEGKLVYTERLLLANSR